MQRSLTRAAGMSLVESLVALVVLSVGMLGVAGLMLTGIASNRSALYRTQAVNLVSDMADRIRANATARAAYDSAGYGGAAAEHDCTATHAALGSNCTIAQLAEDDIARWQAAVGNLLPAFQGTTARGEVQFIAAAFSGQPDTYRISVRWQEPRERTEFNYQTDVELIARPAVN